MIFRTLITAVALCIVGTATAQITTVQLSHEVRLADIRLPESAGGTLGFRACSDCDFQTTRVGSDCTWFLNNQPVSFEQFREAVSEIKNRSEQYLSVLHHLKRDQITEVAIVIR